MRQSSINSNSALPSAAELLAASALGCSRRVGNMQTRIEHTHNSSQHPAVPTRALLKLATCKSNKTKRITVHNIQLWAHLQSCGPWAQQAPPACSCFCWPCSACCHRPALCWTPRPAQRGPASCPAPPWQSSHSPCLCPCCSVPRPRSPPAAESGRDCGNDNTGHLHAVWCRTAFDNFYAGICPLHCMKVFGVIQGLLCKETLPLQSLLVPLQTYDLMSLLTYHQTRHHRLGQPWRD